MSEKPTAVGRYIDLYRELCGTTPLLNNQECEVITRLVVDSVLAAVEREMHWRERAEKAEAALAMRSDMNSSGVKP